MKTSPRPVIAIALGWAVLAILVLASGVAARTAPGVIPALVFLSSATLIVVLGRNSALRGAIGAVPTTWLVGLNGTRLIGASFLWYYAQDRLPAAFANNAGWGDIAAAIAAIALLASGAHRSRGWLLAWNVFGTLDLFVAVGTAAFETFQGPRTMIEMTRLPLGLVPLFAVPMLLAVHAEIFRRLRLGTVDSSAPTESLARA